MNGQIRITWNMHWLCNYRCPYCFFEGHWEEYGGRAVRKSTQDWLAAWERLARRYGRAAVTITGGEPFIFPDILALLEGLSRMHWPVNVTTNTSVLLDEFIRSADPARISVSTSFHPDYHELGTFLARLKRLRGAGFLGCNNFVAYPPRLPMLRSCVEAFAAIGESLKIVPFIGTFEGGRYPEAYTPEQRRLLGMADGWVDDKRRKGRPCLAGHRCALLLPDGKVARCGQIGDRHIIGDFFSPEFSLLEAPAPCDEELCPCDEWKVIPDEKPPERAGAWLP